MNDAVMRSLITHHHRPAALRCTAVIAFLAAIESGDDQFEGASHSATIDAATNAPRRIIPATGVGEGAGLAATGRLGRMTTIGVLVELATRVEAWHIGGQLRVSMLCSAAADPQRAEAAAAELGVRGTGNLEAARGSRRRAGRGALRGHADGGRGVRRGGGQDTDRLCQPDSISRAHSRCRSRVASALLAPGACSIAAFHHVSSVLPRS